MCVLSHVAHFFLLSLVQPCLPGRTQATSGAQGVRDIRKWIFGIPASAGQLGTPKRGCDGCLSLLCCRCVCWRWFVVKVLRYTLFMKKKYFPIHRRLKCFSFIWVKCHKKEAKQDRCWLELTQAGELVLLLPECVLATKYYAQRDIPPSHAHCSWERAPTIVSVLCISEMWLQTQGIQKVGMNVCNQKLRPQKCNFIFK